MTLTSPPPVSIMSWTENAILFCKIEEFYSSINLMRLLHASIRVWILALQIILWDSKLCKSRCGMDRIDHFVGHLGTAAGHGVKIAKLLLILIIFYYSYPYSCLNIFIVHELIHKQSYAIFEARAKLHPKTTAFYTAANNCHKLILFASDKVKWRHKQKKQGWRIQITIL